MYLEVADTALLTKVNAIFLALIALLILLVACDLPSDRSSDFVTTSADLVFASEDFSLGELTDVDSNASGLTLAPGAFTGQYSSPEIDAPMDFNAVVPQWLADVPEKASMTISLRTGTDNGWWSDWLELAENDDWTRP